MLKSLKPLYTSRSGKLSFLTLIVKAIAYRQKNTPIKGYFL
ncbi:hypothetical protein BCLUESOX_87 [bacterium endosymbiont of Bathymodiolus sp. 5 South]|nr:hypothetical protein BCLUESOX_87 [bacterium endosymbiont of Bathymodiolus sp. 5 South]VVH57714.1 hypothetical protein BSPCLSOX_490 [uncultured Gammaproteobacteria bacterium]VVH62808.1 hypothetical protein BSPWISOX_545 [uncultured Gammaproteobacteria bacterium]